MLDFEDENVVAVFDEAAGLGDVDEPCREMPRMVFV